MIMIEFASDFKLYANGNKLVVILDRLSRAVVRECIVSFPPSLTS